MLEEIFFFKGNSNRRKHVNSIPDDQIFHFRDNPLPSAPDSLMEAVRSFVVLVAHSLINDINGPQSMMVHPTNIIELLNQELRVLQVNNTLNG